MSSRSVLIIVSDLQKGSVITRRLLKDSIETSRRDLGGASHGTYRGLHRYF